MNTESRERLVDLASRAQRGDPDAEELFMVEVAKRASRMVGACTGFGEDEQDVLQAVLTDVYLSLPKLREPARVGGWLARIVQRRTRDMLRRKYAEAEFRVSDQEFSLDDLPSRKSTDSFLAPLFQDLTEVLQKELNRLPARYREVLLLALIQGLDIPEIAVEMKLPTNTVKTRYHRGMHRLRSNLERAQ